MTSPKRSTNHQGNSTDVVPILRKLELKEMEAKDAPPNTRQLSGIGLSTSTELPRRTKFLFLMQTLVLEMWEAKYLS